MSSTGKFRIVKVARDVVRLRVDQDVAAPGDLQPEQAVQLGYRQAERFAVELARLVQVVHGEAAECLRVFEHYGRLSSGMVRSCHKTAAPPKSHRLGPRRRGPAHATRLGRPKRSKKPMSLRGSAGCSGQRA